jgi:hypothetical protein
VIGDLLAQLQPALGVLALAIAAGALLAAGTRIAARLLGDAPPAVWCAGTAIAATWLLAALSMVLLFTGCYRPWSVTLGSVILALLTRRLAGTGPPVGELVRRTAGDVRALGLPAVLLAVALLGALAFQAARGLLLPPLSWDSLTYHLTIAARWVQDGGYSPLPFPDALWDYGHYPHGGELVTAFLLLPFHGDLLANLAAFPFLGLAAAATFALAREAGAGPRDAGLAAAVVMVSPPLFAYLTTQYVDLQVTAESLAAVLFLVRSLRARATGDTVLAFAAVGLAFGTKQSAVLLTAPAVAALLLTVRGRSWAQVAAALLVLAAVGLPWYVRNWIETGNPVFPFAVTFGGHELLPGSIYRSATLAKMPDLSELPFLQRLLIYAPNAREDDLALTFGPKLPLLLAAGLLGLGVLWRARQRATAILLAAVVGLEVLSVAAPSAKAIRDRWPEVTHRFFATSVAILAAAVAVALARMPQLAASCVRLLLAGLLACDLALMNRSIAGEWLLGGTIALLVWIGMLMLLRVPPRYRVFTLGAAIALLAAAAVPLQVHRDRTRYVAYGRAREVHGIPRAAVAGWASLDDPAVPHTIAFASGWDLPGHHWLVYPLFGRRLQNRVLHVPPVPISGTFSYAPAAPLLVDGEEFAGRLRRAGVDRLFTVPPWPPELPAVETTTRHFRLLQSDEGYRIYAVQ